MVMTSAASASPGLPPSLLLDQVKDGALSLETLDWLKWRFGTKEEREASQQTRQWVADQKEIQTDSVRKQLKALGLSAAKLKPDCYGSRLCGDLDRFLAVSDQAKDTAELDRAIKEIAAVHAAIRHTATIGKQYSAATPTAGPAERLRAASLADQLDLAFYSFKPGVDIWNPSPLAASLFAALGSTLSRKTMMDNASMLKTLVNAEGWPTQSRYSRRTAADAWVIVQHADHDPAFQARILGMMEPLAKKGEVDRESFAYLSDRVMVKLDGRQRYGTQFLCVGGRYEAAPLEKPDQVDRLRSELKMAPLAEYQKMFREHVAQNCVAKPTQ